MNNGRPRIGVDARVVVLKRTRAKSRKRGRPRKPEGAVSAAERMRAYRKRLRAAGAKAGSRKLSSAGVQSPERRRLREVLSRLAILKTEHQRLREENDRLHVERQRVSEWNNVSVKELIVIKDALSVAKKRVRLKGSAP
jgi:hypothetical protein